MEAINLNIKDKLFAIFDQMGIKYGRKTLCGKDASMVKSHGPIVTGRLKLVDDEYVLFDVEQTLRLVYPQSIESEKQLELAAPEALIECEVLYTFTHEGFPLYLAIDESGIYLRRCYTNTTTMQRNIEYPIGAYADSQQTALFERSNAQFDFLKENDVLGKLIAAFKKNTLFNEKVIKECVKIIHMELTKFS